MFDKRISIFAGHFGSGKTEVAVNYAVKMNELYGKTAIVDLDIVNPFFRTADAAEILKSKGIRVVLPMYANSNVDVPALPPEINTLFEKKDYRVILDIGGDDLGARVVSRYHDDIAADDYALYLVINTHRPMTDTPGKIADMIMEIQASANTRVTGLVNNTNILGETQDNDIIVGYRMIEEASKKTGIPIAFTSGLKGSIEGLEGKLGNCVVFGMDKYIRVPWEKE